MEYSFGKKLRDLRVARGLTQEGLADALNEKFNTTYNKGMISKWENGREEPRMDAVRKLTYFFEVTLDEMLGLNKTKSEVEFYDALHQDNVTNVPIVGTIAAGKAIFAAENIEGYMPVLNQFLGSGVYFFLRIKGDSMDLEFPAGSLVLIQKTPEVENGQIAAIRINGYEATVKKVIFGNNSISLIPMSTNRDHQPTIYSLDDDVEIIGKVIQAVKVY